MNKANASNMPAKLGLKYISYHLLVPQLVALLATLHKALIEVPCITPSTTIFNFYFYNSNK